MPRRRQKKLTFWEKLRRDRDHIVVCVLIVIITGCFFTMASAHYGYLDPVGGQVLGELVAQGDVSVSGACECPHGCSNVFICEDQNESKKCHNYCKNLNCTPFCGDCNGNVEHRCVEAPQQPGVKVKIRDSKTAIGTSGGGYRPRMLRFTNVKKGWYKVTSGVAVYHDYWNENAGECVSQDETIDVSLGGPPGDGGQTVYRVIDEDHADGIATCDDCDPGDTGDCNLDDTKTLEPGAEFFVPEDGTLYISCEASSVELGSFEIKYERAFCNEDGFNFRCDDHSDAPYPGGIVFNEAFTGNHGFDGEPLWIEHDLDPRLELQQLILAFGNRNLIKFTAEKDQQYKMCYKIRQGNWNFTPPDGITPNYASWEYGATLSTAYHRPNEGGVGLEEYQPPESGWQQHERIFTAEWDKKDENGNVIPVQDLDVYFRTGSAKQSWWTGSIDVDDFGIIKCTNPQCLDSCRRSNLLDPNKNLIIGNKAVNATFDSGQPSSGDWQWRTNNTGPDGTVASEFFVRDDGTDRYMEIRGYNYFPWTQLSGQIGPCKSNSFGTNCHRWDGKVFGSDAGYALYAISKIREDADCFVNPEFVSHANANVDECAPRRELCSDIRLVCQGTPPKAEITGPIHLCAGQSQEIYANVTAPPKYIDNHWALWTTSADSPNIAPGITPVGEFKIAEGNTTIYGRIADPGPARNEFTVNLRVRSEKLRPGPVYANDSLLVKVVECNTEPAEDIHYSGRLNLNPPAGLEDTTNQILDWREILGNISWL
ncbi:hypothetical protein ACFL2D_00360 [Patescibacteria group bacterium]